MGYETSSKAIKWVVIKIMEVFWRVESIGFGSKQLKLLIFDNEQRISNF
jgi:hypothetical protein